MIEVTIEVHGGVIEVTELPEGVYLHVHDYDVEDYDDDDPPAVDANGQPYYGEIWERVGEEFAFERVRGGGDES